MRCNHLSIAITFLTLQLASCDLFDTRDPEDPAGGNESLPQATDDGVLMENFRSAFQQKNIQEYEKLFADTALYNERFIFEPTQSAKTRYLAVFSAWNKTTEGDYFRKVMGQIGSTASPIISLTYPTSPVKYQSDSALYTIEYSLFVPHSESNITTQFAGRSELYVASNKNNIWMIYKWVDIETKKDSSWSDLKGYFAK